MGLPSVCSGRELEPADVEDLYVFCPYGFFCFDWMCIVQHFAFLDEAARDHVFAVQPEALSPTSSRELLALALGATLYSPATRTTLDTDALRVAGVGSTSMVWCLEDSIPHTAVPEGEANIVAALQRLHTGPQEVRDRLPLLFVRVRDADQIRRLTVAAGDALNVLTGFSLPKVNTGNMGPLMEAIKEASGRIGRVLYAMPILETPDVMFLESRRKTLNGLADLFNIYYREQVLCVRVGGTDLSGLFGLRRDRDTTVWDVAVVRDALADIVNRFARLGQFVVTGAVWEHIPGPRLFKPQLRSTPFAESTSRRSLRNRLIHDDVDALMREIALDKANGMYGKTVIHPTHVSIVNAMLAVSADEYEDAMAVAQASTVGGVMASAHGRMNEMGPHALWAEQVLARARVYGVLRNQQALVSLLAAGQEAVTNVYPVVSSEVEASDGSVVPLGVAG